ncbi:elongation factor Ts [candidate division WWE3 bacterium]|nr:elongation factor Ts [candidate division WWE3 bacterium]
MMTNIEIIKKLRGDTGAGVLEIRETLDRFDGDESKAREALLKKVSAKAAGKSDRLASDGLVHAYIHAGGKVGSIVHVSCETDFVAKTEEFKKLCHEIAMQVCANDYESVESAMDSGYIRDSSKKVSDLIAEASGKLGEKIELRRFAKFSVG